MYEFLRKVPLFADLPETDLERLCEMIEEVHLGSGEELFSEGSAGDRAYVIKEGQLEIVKKSGGREVLLAVRRSGEVIGEMSLVEDAPRMATVRARTDSVLLEVAQEQFETLLNGSPSAAKALLYSVIARWRATEAMLRQSEKMAQLGTLTAGLAHEINNPAAAVQRGAEQLRVVERQAREAQLELGKVELSPEQVQRLRGLSGEIDVLARGMDELDPLARADREEEVEDWLDDRELDEAWELAPDLVSMGYTVEELDALEEAFPDKALLRVLAWLVATYSRYSLLEEIHQGAGRISEIVKALKTYAYLDQAPVQEVDVHESLDNTLILLRNRLRAGVILKREYAPDLPRIQAFGSELNQVWTNILDNAADAMNEQGDLLVRTRHQGNWVVVEIVDSGPGIPEEIRERIFDPFFTTKPPGKGTGLGLDISWNIVVNRHKGDIRISSQPGRTCFQVWLPVNFEDVQGPPPSIAGISRPDDEVLSSILDTAKTIAVVGLSKRQDRPAFTVPEYLRRQGYRIIPVTPRYDEVLGEKSYASLRDIPFEVDVVLIFRPSEAVPPIVREAIDIKAKVVWMQEGIVHEAAAEEAQQAGLQVIMDTCMRTTHRRLRGRDRLGHGAGPSGPAVLGQ